MSKRWVIETVETVVGADCFVNPAINCGANKKEPIKMRRLEY
jgi:hypothetical protein